MKNILVAVIIARLIFLNLCHGITGHLINNVPEMPLVVSDKVQEFSKTKEAVALLRQLRAWSDVQKVNEKNPCAWL